VTFAEDSLRIIEIDPSGPAATTALVVGDVVTSIDGVSVVGVDPSTAVSLLYVPLGTTIQLGLARGATVAVMTAPRP
jgi:C-terminal processing protease CtpA/Prc